MIDAMMTIIIICAAVWAFRLANTGKDKDALTPLQKHFQDKKLLKKH